MVETEISQSVKVRASTAPGEVLKATETMQSALSAIKPVVSDIIGNLMDNAIKPNEVTMQLGLGLTFGSDGVLKMLISSGGNASFNVGIKWTRP